MRIWPERLRLQTPLLLSGFRGLVQPTVHSSPSRWVSYRTVVSRKPPSAARERGRTSSRPSRPVQPESKPQPLTNEILRDRLTTALRTTLDRLKFRTEDGPSQLESLDPDGKHWMLLEDSIQRVLFDETRGRNPRAIAQRKRIIRTISEPNVFGDLPTYLHHLFLDKTLELRGLDVRNALNKILDLRYPTEWFPSARATQRDIHLHIGPTNSGKTYNALKRLEAAKSGMYAGPLRLLAHEVYSRLNARGIPCDLVTGDDVRLDIGEDEPTRIASTVEMVDVGSAVEVAVIDEIQMIADPERGWAWARALMGVKADEVHLCGEARVLPLIKEMAASMGDNLQVHRYERLNPLKAMSHSLRGNFKKLCKGDCIVTFSIMNIHALRSMIEKTTGRRVAIVYGSLPSETRAKQAALFNDPDNDYDFLVASDAIGMGLNLAIKRIVFDSIYKFDGVRRKQLSIPQIKQIAGRAGRYRTARDDDKKKLDANPPASADANVGWVTCVDEEDLSVIQDALGREPPPLTQAGLLPPGDFVVAYADRLPAGVPHDYIFQRLCDAAAINRRFFLCSIRDQVKIARSIQNVTGLSGHDRVSLTASPADTRTEVGTKVIRALARAIAKKKPVTIADIPEVPLEVLELPLTSGRHYLIQLEHLHRAIIVYLWLSYRFMTIISDQDMAFHSKQLCEEKISEYLSTFSANKRLRHPTLKDGADRDSSEEATGGAQPYFGEHATEDLDEEVAAASDVEATMREDHSSLSIDWSRHDENNTDAHPDGDQPSPEKATSQS